MKSVYRKINERRMQKVYDSIWYTPKDNFKKYVRSGLQMSGKGYDDIKDLFVSDLKLISGGAEFEQTLDYFPRKFLKSFKGTPFSNALTEASDKGLPAYAYRGQFMESYCNESGLLDERLIEEAYKNYQYPGGLISAIKEVSDVDQNVDLKENNELLKVYKYAEKVYVSELEKTINIVFVEKIHGIELNYHPLRYDLMPFNPKYYPQDTNISEILKKIDEIKEKANCPTLLDVENFLIWLEFSLVGVDRDNYLFFTACLSPDDIIWNYEADLRLKTTSLYSKYEGYKINVYRVVADPIANGKTVAFMTPKFHVGYNYENDELFKALMSGDLDLSENLRIKYGYKNQAK